MCQDCERLYDEMKNLETELYQVKKAYTRVKGELRYERREKAKLLKEKKEQQHYRNGQKRGKRGRNG